MKLLRSWKSAVVVAIAVVVMGVSVAGGAKPASAHTSLGLSLNLGGPVYAPYPAYPVYPAYPGYYAPAYGYPYNSLGVFIGGGPGYYGHYHYGHYAYGHPGFRGHVVHGFRHR